MNQQQIDHMKAMLAQGQLWHDIVLHEYATVLVAEVERLREVLEAIANARHVRYVPHGNEGYFQDGIEEGLRMAHDMARAALEDQP